MARSKRSASLDSKNKRLSLPAGKRVVEQLKTGGYLLYRRPMNGSAGSWSARWYDTETREQKHLRLGDADDFLPADGSATLTYTQAQAKAGAWFQECHRLALMVASGEAPSSGPYTVEDAANDYLRDAARRGIKGLNVTTLTLKAHILPSLGGVTLAKLTRKKIEDWHHALAAQSRRKTGKVREQAEHLDEAVDAEFTRRRKNTANRILSVLKAALNYAYQSGKYVGATAWREVRPFKAVTQSRVRFLSVKEQQQLVEACEREFLPLVQAALYSGARYGELTRLRCKDFDPTSGTLFIEISKSGKSRHIWLTEEAQAWFVEQVRGRKPSEVLLQRPVKREVDDVASDSAWAPHDQKPFMARACAEANLVPLTFHELRHTYASSLVNAGVPLAYVAAQLGHADTRMVERFYGHLAPSAVAEAIRNLAPQLNLQSSGKVARLRTKRA